MTDRQARDLPLDAHLHTDLSPDSDVPIDVYAAAGARARHRRAGDHRPRRLRARRAGLRLRDLRRPRADRPRRRRALGAAGRRDPVRRRAHLRPLAGRRTSATTWPGTPTTSRSARSTTGSSRRTTPRDVAGWVAGRSLARSSPRRSTRSTAAARSGLFDTIGHIDVVKRYLYPHVTPGARSRRSRSCTSRSCGRSSRAARPSRSTPAACATRSPRRIPSPAIVARFRELGGRAVTVGSDAHRAEHFALGARRRLRGARAGRVRAPRRPRRRSARSSRRRLG